MAAGRHRAAGGPAEPSLFRKYRGRSIRASHRRAVCEPHLSSHIFFDLSRLLWRSERFAPTGIDRVELAYARHLIATTRDRLSFVGWWGRFGPLPDNLAAAFVESLDALWSGNI